MFGHSLCVSVTTAVGPPETDAETSSPVQGHARNQGHPSFPVSVYILRSKQIEVITEQEQTL